MSRESKRVYKLSGNMWRALKQIAKARPAPETILNATTRTSLLGRELVSEVKYGFVLTETGQRVYARLSVGLFCRCCSKPLAFQRRAFVPNTPGAVECEPCANKKIPSLHD